MSKREVVRTTLRIPESLMREVYKAKANESLNDFICRCVQHYCDELTRRAIDKQFDTMNGYGGSVRGGSLGGGLLGGSQ